MSYYVGPPNDPATDSRIISPERAAAIKAEWREISAHWQAMRKMWIAPVRADPDDRCEFVIRSGECGVLAISQIRIADNPSSRYCKLCDEHDRRMRSAGFEPEPLAARTI